jgi:hypothetical protein
MLISPSNGNHEHIHLLNHGVTNEKNGWWMFQDQTLDIMTYDHKSLENNFQLLGAQDRNLLRSAYRSIVPAARIERRQIYSCFFFSLSFFFCFFSWWICMFQRTWPENAWSMSILPSPAVMIRHLRHKYHTPDYGLETRQCYYGLVRFRSSLEDWSQGSQLVSTHS